MQALVRLAARVIQVVLPGQQILQPPYGERIEVRLQHPIQRLAPTLYGRRGG